MPKFRMGGGEFEARPQIAPWRLMELSAAVTSKDMTRQMGGMYEFMMAILMPEERDRFNEHMHTLDDDPDVTTKLNEAIGALMLEYQAAPEEGPRQEPRPMAPSSSSEPGPPRTGPTSRVVSLSRGLLSEEQTSPQDGVSAAS